MAVTGPLPPQAMAAVGPLLPLATVVVSPLLPATVEASLLPLATVVVSPLPQLAMAEATPLPQLAMAVVLLPPLDHPPVAAMTLVQELCIATRRAVLLMSLVLPALTVLLVSCLGCLSITQ